MALAEAERPIKSPQQRRRAALWTLVPSMVFLGAACVAAILAPALAPHDPNASQLLAALQPPSASHLLGTDNLGRDVLSRVIYGARVSLIVGFMTALLAGGLGLAAGLVAGYFGRGLDAVLMRLADIQLSIPLLLLAIMVLAVLGPGMRTLILVLGVTGWVLFARTTRSQILQLRNAGFVEAVRSTGAGHLRILARHLLPNVVQTAIVLATFTIPQMILAEAALSFLGLGIQPPTASWGNMIAAGQPYLLVGVWWITFFPGIALFLTVVSINLIGDWLRLRLDPQARDVL
ncbi:MAG TPA: ABC transporter permease, partial [Bacillota bacterium]|nr:ABC transporter permease [Bacillota bacterium]